MSSEQFIAQIPAHVPPSLVVDFDVYDPPNVEHDLQLAWKALQDSGVPDLVWSVRNGGHWLPTRGKLVAAMYADSENFSNRLSILPREIGEHHFGIPQSLDPPEHQPFRMLLNGMLGPKPVMQLEGEIRALAVSMIEEIRGKGGCDFTNDYAYVLPVAIFLKLVDLPIEDRKLLQELNNSIIRPQAATMSVEEATRRLNDYLRGPVEQRLGGDGKDMLSQMINGRVFGRRLTSDEALNMAKLVLQGGIDTVSNLMSFAMRFLAENPDHRHELTQNLELIPAAVEELVRRFPVTVQARTVNRDITYAGVEMKEGDAVILGSLVHGLDERENEQPLVCDFHRSKREQSTFGQGIHRCPGAALARLEVRITLEEWLARIPDFELAASDIRCRGGLVGGVISLPLRWDVASTRQQP
jgi:cytochrome P450